MTTSGSRFGVFVVLAFLTFPSLAKQPDSPRLSLPAKDWEVVVDLAGLTVRNIETQPDGRRYLAAQNDATHVVVSLTLEQVAASHATASCRDSLEAKTKHPPIKIQDVRYSRSGEIDIMRYMVKEFRGQIVNQENVFACQFYDGAYIDLHVSKINYTSADEPLLLDVLNSLRIDKMERSSTELFQQGSRFYLQQDYKSAIKTYSQALELEKTDPKLNRPLWYVLIDNLGMSYGITGDLQKARETFEYGISRDATYPLFYYNLACTYAESNDAARAESYLKKAFDNKANVLPGETMPDPTRDDSFSKLMNNKEFRELAEALTKSR
jgi:tetratricopeptide (TPR) repeat protein